jgi:hypothetical protein
MTGNAALLIANGMAHNFRRVGRKHQANIELVD